MQKLLSCLLVAAVLTGLTLSGCTGTGPGSPGTPDNEPQGETEETGGSSGTEGIPTITGSLEIRVTDAPPEEEVTAILVNIKRIEVHQAVAEQEEQEGNGEQDQEQEQEQEAQSGDGWLTLEVNGTNPFDLIELKNEGVAAVLAVQDLEVGKYTQIRLIIDEISVALAEGTAEESMLSSDELKLIQPFNIEEGMVTILTVDFDAAESVHFTGQGNAIVNPVAKLSVEYTTQI